MIPFKFSHSALLYIDFQSSTRKTKKFYGQGGWTYFTCHERSLAHLCIFAALLAYAVDMRNRKTLKRNCIIGTLFVIITGTLAHFVYDWSGQNYIAGLFFPVSESTWEHMKLCFFPMLLYSLFMRRRLKGEYPCVTSALLFGTLLGTFLIPVIFYTYTGILGKNYLPLDIATFILSVILAFAAIYRLTLSCKMHCFTFWLFLSVAAMAACFFIFTYNPPNIGIFVSPS